IDDIDAEREQAFAARAAQPGAAVVVHDAPAGRRRRCKLAGECRRGGHEGEAEGPRGEPRRSHAAVPPTVSPSMRSVGWPTPTGTLCPSLPQVPTPESSAMSLPIIATRVSTSGP